MRSCIRRNLNKDNTYIIPIEDVKWIETRAPLATIHSTRIPAFISFMAKLHNFAYKRRDKPFEVKPPVSQPLKRKQSSPFPTPSANSCTGENSVQLVKDLQIPFVYPPWTLAKNEKLRNKGIDHFELLDELLHNSMATGAFAQPSSLGVATSDEERAMLGPPKSVGGGGGAIAWYYEALTINRQPTEKFIIGGTITALTEIQGIVGETQYWEAYGLMMGPDERSWRQSLHPCRLPWHNKDEDEAVTSDDDDLLDLEFLDLMEDEKEKMPQRTNVYVREDAGQGEERFQRIEAVGQRALWALVTALSFLVAALVPAIQPNHRYPNQHPEEYEVMEEDGDDVKEENGCPIAVNMAQRGGPKTLSVRKSPLRTGVEARSFVDCYWTKRS
ncbi:hypothetical protein RHGRI_001088 [Rhododendron griersonianum]|uniref:Uncharacterized protein n=1 Tax=Rhododendron griersonianum TaxID=479676 RepID=A0AAV6LK41_9ERIC|nr:hypothetical protein RHGRI_001088 [Rhododendron griersonianum]